MIERTLTKSWFSVPTGTKVVVTGESNDAYPGQPRYRTIIVRRADGQPMIGPDGPKTEVGVAETFLDGEPIPRMARDLSLFDMMGLK